MGKPTQEQRDELWEWCGLVHINNPKQEVANSCEAMGMDIPVNGWYKPDYSRGTSALISLKETPIVDLNSLFKYAVPFLLEKHTIIETYSFRQENGLYYSETCVWDGDERQLKGRLISKAFIQHIDLEEANALALFWALWKVKEESNG